MNLYYTTVSPVELQQSLTSQHVILRLFDISTDLMSYLTSSFLNRELSLIQILNLACFSLNNCPDLIDFRGQLQPIEEKSFNFKDASGLPFQGLSLVL